MINNKELVRRIQQRIENDERIPYYNYDLSRSQQRKIINNLINYYSRCIKKITRLNHALKTHVFYFCPDFYDIINNHNGLPMTKKSASKKAADQFNSLINK